MNTRRLLFLTAVFAFLLEGQPARGFIDTFRPQTLAAACDRAQTITVMKVKKFSKDKEVILFERVKDLKGKYPRPGLREHLSSAHLPAEKKHYLDWVGEGKTIVVFRYENRQAICIGDQWTVSDVVPPMDEGEPWSVEARTEPWFLMAYCGDADKLADAVADILDGKEVVVPCMAGGRDKELRERTGKVTRMRTSLKLKDYDLKRNAAEGERGPKDKSTPGDGGPRTAYLHRKGQTRIMPLGDSITNAAGWRLYLQDLLKKNGYTFRMVGGRNDPLLPEGYWSDHGGCGGWTIGSFPASQEFGGADVDWAGSRPDLVLLMIGTNDMQWGHREGAVDRLEHLLDRIWDDVPDAVILVAQITPFAPGSRVNDRKDGRPLAREVGAYNEGIAKLVAKRAKAGNRVVLVDQHTGFDAAKDLADKCHPSEAGHRKMARKWFEAIQKKSRRRTPTIPTAYCRPSSGSRRTVIRRRWSPLAKRYG